MAIENTDLERRVLAHERILQALIAHTVEFQPEVLQKLRATFGDPAHLTRQEHDYTDTASYAEQFMRQVARLSEAKPDSRAGEADTPSHFNADGVQRSGDPDALGLPTQFRVAQTAGVWRVTKDNDHYGDFVTEEGAVDAAFAAARDRVSMGDAAEVRREPSRQPG